MMPHKKVETLLGRCSNMWGQLSPGIKARIKAYLKHPTSAGWEDIHSIIINPEGTMLTLWQAWLAIDPNAPMRGPRHDMNGPVESWPIFPDSFTLYRAIKAGAGFVPPLT